MSKNTNAQRPENANDGLGVQPIGNKSNSPEVTLDALVKTVHAEQAGKDRADLNGNKRRSIALQLALAYPETLAQWRAQVIALHSKDSEQRAACMDWAAAVLDVHEMTKSDPERRNPVNAFLNAITFAVDCVQGNYADDINMSGKVPFIEGRSRLAIAVWRVLKWSENKKLDGKRSSDMSISVVSKSAEKDAGSAVSWAVLSDCIRDLSGRKATNRHVKQAISAAKPLEALQVISNIAAADVSAHFKSGGARIQSIDTAEDILALASSGEEFAALNKRAATLFEEYREAVRTSAAAAVAAAKGNPDAAAKIAATLKAA